MAETVTPGKRPQKEDIFVHHHFYGSYHRGENMVVHSLAEMNKCPTCRKQEEKRQKQIVGRQQQRERVEKLETLLRRSIYYIESATHNYPGTGAQKTLKEIEAALKELKAE